MKSIRLLLMLLFAASSNALSAEPDSQKAATLETQVKV